MSGRRHQEESKSLIREARLGKKHPMFGKTTEEETKIKLSMA